MGYKEKEQVKVWRENEVLSEPYGI